MDAYLKFEGPNVEGESMDKGHEKWIELDGWSWNLEMPLTQSKSSAGARTAGQVNKEPMSVTKNMDKTSPELFEAMCMGRHFKKVQLEVMRSIGDDKKQVICHYEMENVVISQMQTDGGDDAPTETLQLDPGSVKFTYTHTAQDTGKKLGQLQRAWDFIKNKKI